MLVHQDHRGGALIRRQEGIFLPWQHDKDCRRDVCWSGKLHWDLAFPLPKFDPPSPPAPTGEIELPTIPRDRPGAYPLGYGEQDVVELQVRHALPSKPTVHPCPERVSPTWGSRRLLKRHALSRATTIPTDPHKLVVLRCGYNWPRPTKCEPGWTREYWEPTDYSRDERLSVSLGEWLRGWRDWPEDFKRTPPWGLGAFKAPHRPALSIIVPGDPPMGPLNQGGGRPMVSPTAPIPMRDDLGAGFYVIRHIGQDHPHLVRGAGRATYHTDLYAEIRRCWRASFAAQPWLWTQLFTNDGSGYDGTMPIGLNVTVRKYIADAPDHTSIWRRYVTDPRDTKLRGEEPFYSGPLLRRLWKPIDADKGGPPFFWDGYTILPTRMAPGGILSVGRKKKKNGRGREQKKSGKCRSWRPVLQPHRHRDPWSEASWLWPLFPSLTHGHPLCRRIRNALSLLLGRDEGSRSKPSPIPPGAWRRRIWRVPPARPIDPDLERWFAQQRHDTDHLAEWQLREARRQLINEVDYRALECPPLPFPRQQYLVRGGPRDKEAEGRIEAIARTVARRWDAARGYHHVPDLIQEGWIGYLEALPRFDPDQGSLKAFMSKPVAGKAWHYLRWQGKPLTISNNYTTWCRDRDDGLMLSALDLDEAIVAEGEARLQHEVTAHEASEPTDAGAWMARQLGTLDRAREVACGVLAGSEREIVQRRLDGHSVEDAGRMIGLKRTAAYECFNAARNRMLAALEPYLRYSRMEGAEP